MEAQAYTAGAVQVLGATIIAFLIYQLSISAYRLFFHPLSKFPGPWHYAASRFFLLYQNNVRGTFFLTVKELHDEYGSIVRIAPNKLSVDGATGWRDIYGHKLQGQPEFPRSMRFFPAFEANNSLITADQSNHRRMRRLVSHAFSESAISTQEATIKKYTDMLISQLGARHGQVVDISNWFIFTTFDLIGDLAFGEPFDCLESGKLHRWVPLIASNIKAIARLQIIMEYPILKPLLGLFVTAETRRKRAEHQKLTHSKAERRIQAGADARPDFMSYILRHNDEKGMTHAEILRNSGTLILAGSETTATALSGLIYYLLINPEVYVRLVKEIRGAFTAEVDITLVAVKNLRFLSACLEETLRLHPPIVETPGRVSPGAFVGGRYVPKDTELVIFQTTHKLESYFHKASQFIPDRWLTSSLPPTSPLKNDNLLASQPFSAGPRNCLGKNLAYAEMRLIATRLLWRFDLRLEEKSRGWTEQQRVWINFWRKPLLVRIEERVK